MRYILHCITIHYTLNYITLHNITLHHITLKYISPYHITLTHLKSHYITLNCIALQPKTQYQRNVARCSKVSQGVAKCSEILGEQFPFVTGLHRTPSCDTLRHYATRWKTGFRFSDLRPRVVKLHIVVSHALMKKIANRTINSQRTRLRGIEQFAQVHREAIINYLKITFFVGK